MLCTVSNARYLDIIRVEAVGEREFTMSFVIDKLCLQLIFVVILFVCIRISTPVVIRLDVVFNVFVYIAHLIIYLGIGLDKPEYLGS